ncbi:ATP-binding protein [Streptomyces sp. TP-A0356]|uniref:ATP-binding protein n=1 Tax=Streptomyces sp. TP-A0356 TaxID=1359208 RepID=UPI0006E20734|nr:ATP-binding protein [Streptomyces sp. TP-A0356]
MSPHTIPAPLLLDATSPQRAHRFELPAQRSSVAVARRSVDAWLGSRQLPADVRADAALLVSELVTNAVIHTPSTRVLCAVELVPDAGLGLGVHDEDVTGRGLPPCRPGTDDESGRGLLLVREIAAAWGVERSALTGGNVVWATLTWPSRWPPCGPAAQGPTGD